MAEKEGYIMRDQARSVRAGLGVMLEEIQEGSMRYNLKVSGRGES